MPFKSKAQWRACFAADDPNWDCSEMAHSTPSYKELPKKKKKEKKADSSALTPKRVRVAMPHEEGYLMEKLKNPKYPENIGRIRFPGGGIDEGETPEEAAVRELKEELGIDITAEDLARLGVYPDGVKGPEQYFQLDKHTVAPGNYKATVGGDKDIELISGKTDDKNYWGGQLNALKQAASVPAPSDSSDVYVQSAVPSNVLDTVRKHGLLSSQALMNNPESLKAFLANRAGTEWGEDEETFKKRITEKLKDSFFSDSARGPSVFFGDPDPEKITDAHPSRKLKTEPIRVNLSKLLQAQPKTRISGSELQPYDPEGPEHQGDLRHYDIDLDKVREYASTAPKELWKHYNDPEGVRYAGNVPHAQIVTPSGSIAPEYLDFEQKKANITALLEAKKESDRKNYSAKHDILRKMIKEHPEEFLTDSEKNNTYGITHVPTGFKMHIPKTALPRKESMATTPGAIQTTHSPISTKSASTMLSHFLADSFNQRVNGVTSGIFKENAYGVPAQNANALVPPPSQNETALAGQTPDPLGSVTDPLNPSIPAAIPQTPGIAGTDPAETANLKAEAQSFVRPKGGASLNAAVPTQTAQAPNSTVAPGFGMGSFAGGNEPPTGFSLQNSQFGTGAGVGKPLTVTASLNSLVAGSTLFIN